MASSRKKVLIRTHAQTVHAGYLPDACFARPAVPGGEPVLDLLEPAGHILVLALQTIRTIAYVRDFNLGDTINPENLTRRTFLARPRTEGLWVRITFRSGEGRQEPPRATEPLDILEGLAPTGARLLDELLADKGLFLIPPDLRSNTLRLFVPRTAIAGLELLAVITTPSKAQGKKAVEPRGRPGQKELFAPIESLP